MNNKVMQFLACAPEYRRYSAAIIAKRTGVSITTVRSTLNSARDKGLIERDLDVGLNGKALYKWYHVGGITQ